jgi:predicted ArsR family transcriptional regulator
MKTSEKILEYIQLKKQASVHDLVDFIELSRMAVSKQLANLLAEGKLSKIGKPPKVFYEIQEHCENKNRDYCSAKNFE